MRTSRGPSIDSTGSRDIDDDDDDDDENKLDNEEPRHWVYGLKEGTILQAKVRLPKRFPVEPAVMLFK